MKLFGKIDTRRTLWTLRINWAFILAFAVFWSYGFFGAVILRSVPLDALLSLFFLILFTALVWAGYTRKKIFSESIPVTAGDIAVFISYILIITVFSAGTLSNYPQGDEIAHAQTAQIHPIVLVNLLAGRTPAFNDISFSLLIYVIDLVLLVAAGVFAFLVRKKPPVRKAVIFIILFACARVFMTVAFYGMNPRTVDPHPPLRLFPLWFFSSLLSPSPFAFRLPSLLALGGLMFMVQKNMSEKASPLLAWLAGLAVGTIPVLWHSGLIVEQSIWTCLAWTGLSLAVLNTPLEKFPWIRWISVISLATLMRQPAFAGFLPLLLLYAVFYLKTPYNKRPKFQDILWLGLPVLVMLPFTLLSILKGTPSSSTAAQASALARILTAITSGTALQVIVKNVMIPWIVFFVFIFIGRIREWWRNAALAALFAAGFVLFYSIKPEFWGVGRYQAEYVVPLVIAGFCAIMIRLGTFGKIRPFLPLVPAALAVFNFFMFLNLDRMNSARDLLESNYRKLVVISERNFDYHSAFREVRKAGLAGSTYVAGITYGTFPQIMSGFRVGDILSLSRFDSVVSNTFEGLSGRDIDANTNIRLVLVSDPINRNVRTELERLGWVSWKDFVNTDNSLTIYGLKRKGGL